MLLIVKETHTKLHLLLNIIYRLMATLKLCFQKKLLCLTKVTQQVHARECQGFNLRLSVCFQILTALQANIN